VQIGERLIDLPQDPTAKSLRESGDAELICRSKAGDADAFAELVVRYRGRIYSVVYRVVRHEYDALDILQDVFSTAWQSVHRFEGRSSLYTWLYKLAINATFTSIRRNGHRNNEMLRDTIPSSLPGPLANCERIEIAECLNGALAKLSAEHRTAVMLKELEGMRYHEIAAFLNISVGTVMSRLFYAKRHLRSLLRPVYSKSNLRFLFPKTP
jgi:RNA polymerase sigma-70 factor (ECF subfamily)